MKAFAPKRSAGKAMRRGNMRGAAAMASAPNLDLQNGDLQMQLDIEAVVVQYDEQIQEVLDEIMRREIQATTERFDEQLAPLLAALNEKLAAAH